MSHTRYESDCFVLEAMNQGEANAHYLLFTKDFGLLRASAQGVRHEKGKLRYSLQEFSRAEVSLVRGREFWRVVGATSIAHFWGEGKLGEDRLELLAKIFKLLRRLVAGEEQNEALFYLLEKVVLFMEQEAFTKEELLTLEIWLVARILALLGYFEITSEYRGLFEDEMIERSILTKVSEVQKGLLLDINRALKETQL